MEYDESYQKMFYKYFFDTENTASNKNAKQ